MSSIHLTIKGQSYLATFCEASDGFGPYYRVTRHEKNTDNLRGGYVVRVDEAGRPLGCTCPDSHWHNRNNGPNDGTYLCKHARVIDGIYLKSLRNFDEEVQRAGLGVHQLEDFVAMKAGEVRQVGCHRVERLPSCWQVDERTAISWNRLREYLAESTPCKVLPVDPSQPNSPFARLGENP